MSHCGTCRFWRYDESYGRGECEQITNGDETIDYDIDGHWTKNTYDLLILVKEGPVLTRRDFGCVLHEEKPSE